MSWKAWAGELPTAPYLMYVALQIPAVYELFPIAALIGTLYALVQLANHSSDRAACLRLVGGAHGASLLRAGLLFVLFTFVVGEFICRRASVSRPNCASAR